VVGALRDGKIQLQQRGVRYLRFGFHVDPISDGRDLMPCVGTGSDPFQNVCEL
jgi:hypothetical protein